MTDPIRIAVVGHTNAGKTSLLRTLTRRSSFGTVSDQPGTTRHVESIDLMQDGRCAARFFDTPGLEDSIALLDHLNTLDPSLTRPGRVRAFLAGPEASRSFEQEAKVLRTLIDADAAFYVIDCREAVLPKFRAEIDILTMCAKPVMPVLNHVRHADNRESEWQEALSAQGLFAKARFDAVAPFIGSEQRLYRDLMALLHDRTNQLAAIVDSLELERLDRRVAAWHVIASLLVDVTALRRTIAADEFAVLRNKQQFIADFRRDVVTRARQAADDLLAVHAFRKDEADLSSMTWLDGRWESDLFNPETLKAAGLQLGAGAAIGASVGVVADVALAGLSLGAGMAIGAAIGGALSQGVGPMGRRIGNKLRGREDLTLENEVILVLAAQMLALLAALETRGHAALTKVQSDLPLDTISMQPLIETLRPARGRPEWSSVGKRRGAAANPRRERLVEEVVATLRRQLPAIAAEGNAV